MKNKRNYIKKLILFLIPICFGVYLVLASTRTMEMNEFNDLYLALWERGINGIFLIIYLLCVMEIVVLDEYNLLYNKVYQNMVVRIGYKELLKKSLIRIFFKSLLYGLLTHIIIIILLNCFHSFDYMVDVVGLQRLYFSSNVYINVAIFIMLSSLGTGILFTSLYPLYIFIKNKYILRMVPLIVLFGSIVLSSVIGSLVYQFVERSILVSTFTFSFVPSSLIEPGCGWYQYAAYDFMMGVFIYILFFIIGMIVVKKRGMLYDW